MTRYRLPDSMGGLEAHLYPDRGSAVIARAKVEALPGHWADVVIERNLLIELEPDLPLEPPDGDVVQVCDPIAGILTFCRDDSAASGPGGHWYGPVGGGYGPSEGARPWVSVCSFGAPVRLVSDPAVGVELPWRFEDAAGHAVEIRRWVETGGGPETATIKLITRGGSLSVGYVPAREAAAALLAAEAQS